MTHAKQKWIVNRLKDVLIVWKPNFVMDGRREIKLSQKPNTLSEA